MVSDSRGDRVAVVSGPVAAASRGWPILVGVTADAFDDFEA